MSTCKHGKSAPTDLVEGLHPSQAGLGRHKCCECAYVQGYNDGLNGITLSHIQTDVCSDTGALATLSVMEDLPFWQGGLTRHKCAICAYSAGQRLATSKKEEA